MTTDVRVRFAPSPTGNLHIGGARTALYNWAFAKRHGGTFILRIEDTDPERSTDQNTQQILRSLKWMGLSWDEGPEVGGAAGPYQQSKRGALYAEALETLRAHDAVYPCFCSADELDAKRTKAQEEKCYSGYDRTCRALSAQEAQARIDAGEPHTWRIKLPLDRKTIEFDDEVFGHMSIPIEQVDDFILMRTDGSPTYNFVVCVDDVHMGITHVIRGDDHLSNTPKQIMVYEALGAPLPSFAHLSMILGSDGKRLSKRHGATSVEAYKDEGYLSEALFNYLALLGWSLDGETTIISKETIAKEFDLRRVSKNPAVFDPQKLDWMNQVYIKEMGATAFVDAWEPFLAEAGLASASDIAQNKSWFEAIYPLVAERVHTLGEVNEKVSYLFGGPHIVFDEKSVEKGLKNDTAPLVISETLKLLENKDVQWTVDSLEETLKLLPEQLDLKPRVVFQALRVALTGNLVSLPLYESMELIGKEACISRVLQAQELMGT